MAGSPIAAQDPAPGPTLAPIGAAEYVRRIEAYTTRERTTDELRDLGRRELDRVLEELRGVMAEVGFEGTSEEFFEFLRSDDRFYYPDTEEGRAAYLDEARRWIGVATARVGEIVEPPPGFLAPDVGTMPEGLPPRSQQLAMAMYRAPGAKTGTSIAPENGMVLFNLTDMRSAPTYLLPVVAFHEGGPGHHLQIAVGRASPPELQGRAIAAAWGEGWAAYGQQLPWELGMVEDPYADAGRLGLSSWWFARLIAEVGLQVDGWTREEAVAFLLANAPISEMKARLDVERCIEQPGLGTTYVLGMIEFQELRRHAEAALGPRFDMRAFHGVVLSRSGLSFAELETVIDAWIAEGGG